MVVQLYNFIFIQFIQILIYAIYTVIVLNKYQSRDLAPRACLYLSLSISHFNLAYLDLFKFTLFDEPLQRGLVVPCYDPDFCGKN